MSQRVLNADNDIREAVATNHIDALLLTDRPADAEMVARQLLQDRRQARNPRAGSLAQTLEQLGLCLLAEDRFEEAAKTFAECASFRETIDSDHWLTNRARSYRGTALVGLGRFEEAEPLLVEAARAVEQASASIAANMRDREVNNAFEHVAQMYDAWGRPDDAAAWRDQTAAR